MLKYPLMSMTDALSLLFSISDDVQRPGCMFSWFARTLWGGLGTERTWLDLRNGRFHCVTSTPLLLALSGCLACHTKCCIKHISIRAGHQRVCWGWEGAAFRECEYKWMLAVQMARQDGQKKWILTSAVGLRKREGLLTCLPTLLLHEPKGNCSDSSVLDSSWRAPLLEAQPTWSPSAQRVQGKIITWKSRRRFMAVI